MDAVTYPDEGVQKEISDHYVACRLVSADHPDVARRCNVRWLPGIVLMGGDERPHHVSIGYLPPQDFLAESLFGRALAAMAAKEYENSERLFDSFHDCFSSHDRAPESLYWHGVSELRRTKDFAKVLVWWKRIVDEYPASSWSRKVEFLL